MSTPPRVRDGNPNLDIWLRNRATDPHVDGPGSAPTTKPITGKDYSGTSLAPLYIVMRMTQEFGPIGEGWGIDVVKEEYVPGETYYNENGNVIGTEKMHTVLAKVWWRRKGAKKKNKWSGFGATRACYMTGKNKFKMDEDAAKKSLTDCLTKAASLAGIGADIHLGQWDDSKYREERTRDETRTAAAKPLAFVSEKGDIFYAKDIVDWKASWIRRINGRMAGGQREALERSQIDNATAFASTSNVYPEDVAEIEAALQSALKPSAAQPVTNGAAAPNPAANGVTLPLVPEPPTGPPKPKTLTMLGQDKKLYTYEKDIRNPERTVDGAWLTGFKVSLERITNPAGLEGWLKANEEHLKVVQEHFPERAAEALALFDARRAKVDTSQQAGK